MRILTVEDNKLFAKILEYNLSDGLRIEVRHVESGEACLANLDWNPDLIILDFELPSMNRIETLKRIKSKNKETKVIALSCHSTTSVIEDFMNEGILLFIDKNNNPMGKLMQYIKEMTI